MLLLDRGRRLDPDLSGEPGRGQADDRQGHPAGARRELPAAPPRSCDPGSFWHSRQRASGVLCVAHQPSSGRSSEADGAVPHSVQKCLGSPCPFGHISMLCFFSTSGWQSVQMSSGMSPCSLQSRRVSFNSSWQRVQNFSGTPCSLQYKPASCRRLRGRAEPGPGGHQVRAGHGQAEAGQREDDERDHSTEDDPFHRSLLVCPKTGPGREGSAHAGPLAESTRGWRWARGGAGRAQCARSWRGHARGARWAQQRKFWSRERTALASPDPARPAGPPSRLRRGESGRRGA